MTARPVLAWVALGSNLGDRAAHLSRARARLAALPRSTLVAESAVEETVPLGGMDQPAYLNQMLLLRTTLSPHELLDACHAAEQEAGRLRGKRWDSRTLDVDIVRYGDLTLDDPTLTLPHPGLATRDFWQREMAELEPHAR